MSEPDYRDSGLDAQIVADAPEVRRMVLSKPQTQGFTRGSRASGGTMRISVTDPIGATSR